VLYRNKIARMLSFLISNRFLQRWCQAVPGHIEAKALINTVAFEYFVD
jgi:hypothetical protein